jgi:hypothetical protein
LFRCGTNPYNGRPYGSDHAMAVGCAGALLAELMLLTYTPRGETDALPCQVTTCVPEPDTGRPLLVVPTLEQARHVPVEDRLLRQVLTVLADDQQTRGEPRLVREVIVYLATTDPDAYTRVGRRMDAAGLMRAERHRGEQAWVAVEFTASLNALMRLPRALDAHRELGEADRVLWGLLDALDLTHRARREFGRRFKLPAELGLRADLQALIDTTRAVVASAARQPHR